MASVPTDDELLDLVASEALVERSKLRRDASLEDLGIASLDVITILFEVEDRFGVVVEAEELAGCPTLGDLLDTLRTRAAAA